MMPIPPTHCVVARQMSIEWDNTDGSGRIEAPVVVKPAVVSKKAFVGSPIAPVMRYGNVPKMAITNQDIPTTANPSRVLKRPARPMNRHP